MDDVRPLCFILGGPNGAGKSTMARRWLARHPECQAFLNADMIAKEMNPDHPEQAAMAAGTQMLLTMDELIARKATFAFETTLSGRTWIRTIRRMRAEGFAVHLAFIWVATPEELLVRVANRVLEGGHHIPEADIRRRHPRTIRNLLTIYRHMVDDWQLLENTIGGYVPVAHGTDTSIVVDDPLRFADLCKRHPEAFDDTH